MIIYGEIILSALLLTSALLGNIIAFMKLRNIQLNNAAKVEQLSKDIKIIKHDITRIKSCLLTNIPDSKSLFTETAIPRSYEQ